MPLALIAALLAIGLFSHINIGVRHILLYLYRLRGLWPARLSINCFVRAHKTADG